MSEMTTLDMVAEVAAPATDAAFSPFALSDGGGDAQLLFSAQREFGSRSRASNNFTRGVRVSPDGLCVLTNSDDHVLRLFELSADLDAVRTLGT